MTREQWLDEQVAAWLEAGPEAAPGQVTERAVAYARAHPRGWRTLADLRRSLMNRVHLTRVETSPIGRLAFAAYGAAAALVVVAVGGMVLLGGIGAPSGGAGPVGPTATATPSPTPSPTPTPSPATSPTPEPSLPIAVTGEITCPMGTGNGSGTRVGQIDQYRDVVLSCSVALSDPRASGKTMTVLSIDERADGSAEMWGTSTIDNDAGSWTGDWRGTVDKGYTTHHIVGVYIGSGGYAGLRLRYQFAGAGPTFQMSGTIERVEAVPPTGATVVYGHSCITTDTGTMTQSRGATAYRDVRLACTGTPSDPRLAGTMTLTVNIDERADESAVLSGSLLITNPGGTWTGPFTGTVDAGYTTHRVTATATGTGDYAGLEWSLTLIGTEARYVASGLIQPAS